MYNHQNVVFHLFSLSAATLENIFENSAFSELLSKIRFR